MITYTKFNDYKEVILLLLMSILSDYSQKFFKKALL